VSYRIYEWTIDYVSEKACELASEREIDFGLATGILSDSPCLVDVHKILLNILTAAVTSVSSSRLPLELAMVVADPQPFGMQQFLRSFFFFAFKWQRVMERDEETSRSPFFRLKRERDTIKIPSETRVIFFSFYTGTEINF